MAPSIQMFQIDEEEKLRPLRGSPFTANFVERAKPKANDFAGPSVNAFVNRAIGDLDTFQKATEAGLNVRRGGRKNERSLALDPVCS